MLNGLQLVLLKLTEAREHYLAKVALKGLLLPPLECSVPLINNCVSN